MNIVHDVLECQFNRLRVQGSRVFRPARRGQNHPMTRNHHIALMAEQPLPATAEGGDAPEWIHLLPAPADGLVKTGDTRGPYHLTRSLQSIIDGTPGKARLLLVKT